ncbi:hypothetical protein KOR42_22850 [Thalassoglobus neptunius]|uniref:Chromosome partition protein Smc n=1 Tax=Thalassoglobus neptunius TaxID=1938619 RepID=A0A5C5X7W8_9PLAN|nr:hypothetical protein [Thalassoglobus neptunius]TWT58898.1 hypothetical protein KOR42_22850 [Thalassoglobus neptunius]
MDHTVSIQEVLNHLQSTTSGRDDAFWLLFYVMVFGIVWTGLVFWALWKGSQSIFSAWGKLQDDAMVKHKELQESAMSRTQDIATHFEETIGVMGRECHQSHQQLFQRMMETTDRHSMEIKQALDNNTIALERNNTQLAESGATIHEARAELLRLRESRMSDLNDSGQSESR